eukprot:maker-scaffold874_size86240-snap-gene-0.14 protein:Tk04009 transcript:maker-scaffold874_size86240-snap-gene-0.14-mRNA-1 annotation:"unnamed protein product"
MERLEDDPLGHKAGDLDGMMDSLLSPINVKDILGRSSDLSDENESVTANQGLVTVKIEMIEETEHPKTVCLVPKCGRKFDTNSEEGQPMFRFPAQDQIQAQVWTQILGLGPNPEHGSPWAISSAHFVCGLHFAEIDEPYAKAPNPPNRNEKCEPLAKEKWSQLPTSGDILRAVIVTLGETGSTSGVASIVECIFQLWNKVKCPPIPVKAISTRIFSLLASVPGLKSTDILGARKAEFAGLFDVACPAEERTATFNYEFYRDQMSSRRMFFTPTGMILKPALPPGRVKRGVEEQKDVTLPTWLQLPTQEEVLETMKQSPFSVRTVAKIIRALWKRARCYPFDLENVAEQIRAMQNCLRPESAVTTELFDIAWDQPLRPADFNVVFYQDQKGPRRMFLTPLRIGSNVKTKLRARPPVAITNPRSLSQTTSSGNLLTAQAFASVSRIKTEDGSGPDDVTDPLMAESLEKTQVNQDSSNYSKNSSMSHPMCSARRCHCNVDLNALRTLVVSGNKAGLTESPMIQMAQDTLHRHGVFDLQRLDLVPKVEVGLEVNAAAEPVPASSIMTNEQMKNLIVKLRRERDLAVKLRELYRRVLWEKDLLSKAKKPVYQVMAELNYLACRNKRYRDIIAFHRDNSSQSQKVMGILHQKLLDAQEVIQQYECEPSILAVIREATNSLRNTDSVAGCKAIVDQLLTALIQRDASAQGQTWTSQQWLAEDALLDAYEAEVLEPLTDPELMEFASDSVEHTLECGECHLRFTNQPNFEDHQMLYCDVRESCHVCALKVPPMAKDHHLKGHAEKHDLDSPLTCDECQVQVPNLEAMQTHVKEHHAHQVFCVCCRKSFASPMQMALHWVKNSAKSKKSANPEPMICSGCGILTKLNLADVINHGQVTHVCGEIDKPYGTVYLSCPECGELFRKKAKYDAHVAIPHDPDESVCKFCSRAVLKKRLKDHLLTHTLIHPFKCPMCKKTAGFRTEITTHLKQVHQLTGRVHRTVEVIPEELEKRSRFKRNTVAGIKEFIKPLDLIPGVDVEDAPDVSFKSRKRKAEIEAVFVKEEASSEDDCRDNWSFPEYSVEGSDLSDE